MPANSSEEVFDVEYQEGDGFCHSFLKARDGVDAAHKAIAKHNLHPRDIVGATKCDEPLGNDTAPADLGERRDPSSRAWA